MQEQAKTVHDEWFDPLNNGFGWFVRYVYSDYWCDVNAYEVVALDVDEATGDDVKLFQRKGATYSPDPVATIEEAATYLGGYVNDGCTELDIGKPHMCDLEGVQAHCQLIEHVYRKAIELMGAQ